MGSEAATIIGSIFSMLAGIGIVLIGGIVSISKQEFSPTSIGVMCLGAIVVSLPFVDKLELTGNAFRVETKAYSEAAIKTINDQAANLGINQEEIAKLLKKIASSEKTTEYRAEADLLFNKITESNQKLIALFNRNKNIAEQFTRNDYEAKIKAETILNIR